MRDGHHRHLRGAGEQVAPQQGLGLHVQGARQIVHHQQLGVAHEHARRRDALRLAARHAHPARPHDGVQAPLQGGQVGFQHGGAHRRRQVDLVARQTEQHVVAQRRAQQRRHLRRVGHPRRHQGGGRRVHRAPVPQHPAGIGVQQPQQHAQQRRLAGADASHHGHALPAPHLQVDAAQARPALRHPRICGVTERHPLQGKALEAIGGALRAVGDSRQGTAQMHAARRHQRALLVVAEQLLQPVQRYPHLPQAGQEAAEHADRLLREIGQVVDEQGEVADREAAVDHGAGGHYHDHAGADLRQVVEPGAEQLGQQLIAYRAVQAAVVELLEAVGGALLGGQRLQRRNGRVQLGDEAGDGAGVAPEALVDGGDALAQEAHDYDHAGERDEHQGGEQRVDAGHHDAAGHRERQRAYLKGDLHQQLHDAVHVAAQPADRLARRVRQGVAGRPAERAFQDILAQQRSERELGAEVERHVDEHHHRARQGDGNEPAAQQPRAEHQRAVAAQFIEQHARDDADHLERHAEHQHARAGHEQEVPLAVGEQPRQRRQLAHGVSFRATALTAAPLRSRGAATATGRKRDRPAGGCGGRTPPAARRRAARSSRRASRWPAGAR